MIQIVGGEDIVEDVALIVSVVMMVAGEWFWCERLRSMTSDMDVHIQWNSDDGIGWHGRNRWECKCEVM